MVIIGLVFVLVYYLVVIDNSTRAIDCLERLVSEMTCYVSTLLLSYCSASLASISH